MRVLLPVSRMVSAGRAWVGAGGQVYQIEVSAFWSYPGLVDSSSLGGDVLGDCAPFVLAGAQVAQG